MGDHAASYSEDPFDVLRYAWTRLQPEQAEAGERALAAYEVDAVRVAPPTPGAAEAVAALRVSDHTITIVSNNSEAAIGAFVEGHDLMAGWTGWSVGLGRGPTI
ncbi:hypothetical protein LWC35_23335 [Pseudonocardia kujensis]|uniref:hypothetical protein n=1 Tax=Pseudonocardia kujensis TaxID=1128675 RepID=UPI001E35B90D|nr:hypothetical protein [Pseudonocardia kujensis]MCE0765817.1 hypothetical protein [Pseudonocardia kujensis]